MALTGPGSQNVFTANPGSAQVFAPRAGAQGKSNGFAIAGLVCGILAVILGWTIFFGGILAILAIVFSVLGLHKVKVDPALGGKGMALAGLICGIIGVIEAAFMLIAFAAFFAVLNPQSLLPDQCRTGSGFYCSDFVFTPGQGSFALVNNVGTPITLNANQAQIPSDCSQLTMSIPSQGLQAVNQATLQSGQSALIHVACPGIRSPRVSWKGQFLIPYTSEGSGLMHQVTVDLAANAATAPK
jgi:hypothetical protein